MKQICSLRWWPRPERVALGLLVFCLAAGGGLQAGERDERYVAVFDTIQQADALSDSGKLAAAATKYREAQSALQAFRRAYPDWNPKTVSFRLNYLAEKIAALAEKSAPTTGTSDPGAGAKSDTAAASPAVKLLEAGAEPRAPLRLHPKAGDKQTLTMSLKIGIDLQLGEMPAQAMKLPAINMTMEVLVKDVSAEGDITYESAITESTIAEDPGAAQPVADAMKASLGNFKGLTGTGTISSRGLQKHADMKVPAGANPQMGQVLDQMKDTLASVSAQLPEEAVGPGARWEAPMSVKSQGMTIQQTATYELVSVEGDKVVLKSTLTQKAANQKIQNPAMPGLKVDLERMVGNGTSELTLDLARTLPPAAKMETHSEMSMGMTVAGQKQSMVMKMEIHLDLEAK
jgi:hypothetical protein